MRFNEENFLLLKELLRQALNRHPLPWNITGRAMEVRPPANRNVAVEARDGTVIGRFISRTEALDFIELAQELEIEQVETE